MTCQQKKCLEFDVFAYSKSDRNVSPAGKVYVKINKLVTRDMLTILLKHKLPKGMNYNIDYFVFQDVNFCLQSICEMFRTLQKVNKYNEYSTLCLSMLDEMNDV